MPPGSRRLLGWIPIALACLAGEAGAQDAGVEERDRSATPTAPATPPAAGAPAARHPTPTPTRAPTRADERHSSGSTPAYDRPGVVIKTILGLVALLALAYLGGHPRVRRWEDALGVSQVLTAGFPFVALGVIARQPSVGVLSDQVLADLMPLVRLGLGWIGFAVGFRFDARMLDALPPRTAVAVGLSTSAPLAVIMAASSVLLLASTDLSTRSLLDPAYLRDALVLGTAGAMTALTAPRLVASLGGNREAEGTVTALVRLEQLAGIIGLAFLSAYFRPPAAAGEWQLPGTAWLFVAIGLGAAVGVVVYVILRRPASAAESIVLTLGSICFAAGIASNLRLSPVVVCFVAGVLLVNFPGDYKERLAETLQRLERPIYLVFLTVVGALWRLDDWRGWLLLVVFVAARLVGKWIGTTISWQRDALPLNRDARRILVLSPMGALSIAIVVNAQDLFPGRSISWIVTAVIGGAIVSEILVQLGPRLWRRRQEPAR